MYQGSSPCERRIPSVPRFRRPSPTFVTDSVCAVRQVIASSTGAIIAVANPALTLSAVSQPLSLVTHTKFERVKSGITATRVKTEPTFSSPTRPNGRGRLAD